MKTYTKEEARDLVYSGTHQIHNDCDSLDLLKEVVGSYLQNAVWRFYTCIDYSDNELIGRKVIRLSKIKDDEPKKMTFKYRDLQYKTAAGEWVNFHSEVSGEMRFKPDYSKEIEALEKKAAEYGEKVIINFEVLSNDSNIDNIKPDPSERPITTTIMRNGKIEKYFDGEKWKDINAL